MARVHFRKAAKDYPRNGIKKGDSYYYAKIKTGPRSSRVIRSITPIKRWELTSSDFYSQLWPIEDERFDGVCGPDDLREIAEDLRNLGSEQQDKYDNMPEGLQQGDTGQMVEARATGCEEWADAIDQAADELDNELDAFDTAVTAWKDYAAGMEAYEADGGEGSGEPDEPSEDLPDDLDATDDDAVELARQEIIAAKAQEASEANPGIE